MRRVTPRQSALLVALLPLLGLGWYTAARPAAAPPPFRRAWWYWHHPFRLSGAELKALNATRCDRLYVYAGTLTLRNGTLAVTSLQRFESPVPGELFAVIRVHPSTHRALLAPRGALHLADLLRKLSLPASVRGVQLDADIPTSELPVYARFLSTLRPKLRIGWALSITALPDWLRSRDYSRLCAAVDEIAPQFYGNRWPETGKKPPPLWETERIVERIRQSAVGPARVWVGLPSYGRCVVLDPRGRPIGVRHDISAERLEGVPDWSVAVADTRRGAAGDGDATLEDSLALRAERDNWAGPVAVESGSTLWFQWPRISGLLDLTRSIEALRNPKISGVCFFRWPEPGEPLAVPPAPLSGQVDTPLAVSATRQGREVTVWVENRGMDPPLLPEGVQVEIELPGTEVTAASAVEYRLGDTPCSPLRADRAVVSRALLRPGSRWKVGRVQLTSGVPPVRVSWKDRHGRPQVTTMEVPPLMSEAGEVELPAPPRHAAKKGRQ